jgi:translocation and assembly module TamA
LDQLSFSKQIRPAEVLFTKDTTRVYLYLEKIKNNRFDGFLGFGSDENSGDLQLNGYLNLNLINNLNFGESFRVNYRSDENDLKTFETQLTLPYLFKTPIGSEFEFNIIKKDSTFTTSEQAANVFYQLSPKQKVFLGIRSTQSNALVIENTTDILDYQTSTYEVKYTYRQLTAQNPLSPLTTALEFRLSKANRKTTDTQTNQILYLLKASKLFSLNQKNSFYLRFQAQGIDSDSYLLNELIRFGGINSIRGFEENSINATNLGVLASEYRYQLSPTLYIHSIIDAAYFETPLQSNKKLYGFGFGFGLLTDAGLLKFNLANGQTENQNFRFSDSKIHLSLTATF